MLHSVRFLQSQWNARSPELSLKDLVDFIRPNTSGAVVERARRHYQACRLQCFLRGIAVAVDGPLPSSGALLIGRAEDPDYLVGSVRPSLELRNAPLDVRGIEGALDAGLLVYVRVSKGNADFVSQVCTAARERKRPVLDVVVNGGTHSAPNQPLALREVRVEVLPRASAPNSVH